MNDFNPVASLANWIINTLSLTSDQAIGSAVIISMLLLIMIPLTIAAVFAVLVTWRKW